MLREGKFDERHDPDMRDGRPSVGTDPLLRRLRGDFTEKTKSKSPRPAASIYWTPEDDTILRVEWALGKSARRIGLILRVSKSAVLGRVSRLQLPKRVFHKTKGEWTPEKEVYLRQNFTSMPARLIATTLSVPQRSVYARADKLGLKKVTNRGEKNQAPV